MYITIYNLLMYNACKTCACGLPYMDFLKFPPVLSSLNEKALKSVNMDIEICKWFVCMWIQVCSSYFTILFNHLCKIRKENVIFPQEVERLILLFPHHQLVHELWAITSNKPSCQLDNVTICNTRITWNACKMLFMLKWQNIPKLAIYKCMTLMHKM